ncbi:MAG TPA: zinc-ribbon domain-containing transport protein [Acidimicrobiales bacterium]|nr:zinc-ribbon domain-containing transport protein [Acidimicrobiales bacterium]
MRWGRSKRPDASAPEPAGDGSVYQAGSLFPGTDEAALAGTGPGAVAAGVATIEAHDANFDAGQFVAWASTIYAMATAAWRTGNPAVLRPVMADTVYEPYSGFVLLLTIVPMLQRYMASATANASVRAAHGDQRYDTVVVRFAAALTAEIDPRLELDAASQAWTEDWTFQRPAGWTTHDSGAVAVCPNCGAPASPDGTGACKYCKADITSRTAGWLATRTTTTMRGIVAAHAMLDRRRRTSAAKGDIPSPSPAGEFHAPSQPPRADHPSL